MAVPPPPWWPVPGPVPGRWGASRAALVAFVISLAFLIVVASTLAFVVRTQLLAEPPPPPPPNFSLRSQRSCGTACWDIGVQDVTEPLPLSAFRGTLEVNGQISIWDLRPGTLATRPVYTLAFVDADTIGALDNGDTFRFENPSAPSPGTGYCFLNLELVSSLASSGIGWNC